MCERIRLRTKRRKARYKRFLAAFGSYRKHREAIILSPEAWKKLHRDMELLHWRLGIPLSSIRIPKPMSNHAIWLSVKQKVHERNLRRGTNVKANSSWHLRMADKPMFGRSHMRNYRKGKACIS